tara:strand:+ start:3206 stop:3448 length:243 start_codon:yes stop_codon:yes gene_type:complete
MFEQLFKTCKTPCEKFGVATAEMRHLESAIEGYRSYIEAHSGELHFKFSIKEKKKARKKAEKRLRTIKKIRKQLKKALQP